MGRKLNRIGKEILKFINIFGENSYRAVGILFCAKLNGSYYPGSFEENIINTLVEKGYVYPFSFAPTPLGRTVVNHFWEKKYRKITSKVDPERKFIEEFEEDFGTQKGDALKILEEVQNIPQTAFSHPYLNRTFYRRELLLGNSQRKNIVRKLINENYLKGSISNGYFYGDITLKGERILTLFDSI